jgi:DNA polymerase-3 subunit alpha
MNLIGKNEQDAYLWYLVSKGVIAKYGNKPPQFVLDRISMEMEVITNNKFTDYILMIWDIMDFCATPSRVFTFCAMNGITPPPDGIIPIGPGRGSVGGSMVCHCIDIHECDPILFGLYFERFLNPERIAYPDIDFDISQKYRHIGIAYIAYTYGRQHVAQIITYGTLATKTVMEEVLKTANVPLSQIKDVKATVPDDPSITFKDMIEDTKLNEKFMKAMNSVIFPDTVMKINAGNVEKFSKSTHFAVDKITLEAMNGIRSGEIKEWDFTVKSSWTVSKAIHIMQSLYGLNKHESTHAGGVVVAPVVLDDHVPLMQKDDGPLSCQYDMKSLEELGYLKMDALGLRTVDVNHNADRLVREWFDPSFNIKKVPLDDPEAIRLMREGDTVGIFQIESTGFTQMMMDLDIGGYEAHQRLISEIEKLKNINITDFMWISAGLAMYRPGPLDAIIEGKTMVQHLVDRKAGKEPTTYLFPEEQAYLEETYGIMIYQEQVMARVRQLTGCSYGRADLLRKAMGKKDPVLMKEQMDWLRAEAMGHEFTVKPMDLIQKQRIIDRACDEIDKFARYGFNKAHTVEYGMICYRNAYFKAHYPACFYASLLNSESGDPKRLATIIRDMIRHNVQLLPPLVSKSGIDFTMTDQNTVRFGLAAIKGLGEKGLKAILDEKQQNGDFTSPEDFKIRVPGTVCNVNTFTSLAKCGAFDDMLDQTIMSIKDRATLVSTAKDMCAIITKCTAKKGKLKPKPTAQEALDKLMATRYVVTEGTEDLIEYATWEKSILNYFISAHPMDAYIDEIERWTAISDTNMEDLPKEFYIGGFIAEYHETTIKKEGRNKGKAMGFVTIETEFRAYEATMFPGIWESCLPYIKGGGAVVLKGRRDNYRDAVSIQGMYMRNLVNSGIRDCPECHIRLTSTDVLDMMELRNMFNECPGLTEVYLHVTHGYNDITIKCGQMIALNDRIIDYCNKIGKLAYKAI